MFDELIVVVDFGLVPLRRKYARFGCMRYRGETRTLVEGGP